MPNYIYEIVSTGQQIEVEQRITEPAHTVLEVDGELVTVRRLISGAGNFMLMGGQWAADGYSQPLGVRKAEKILGKKVSKRQ